MYNTLNANANIIELLEVIKFKIDVIKFLEFLEPKLSKDEYLRVKYHIESYVIPTPRLLLKDYKKIKKNGVFRGRLIVPVQSSNSRFSKLRYLRIKEYFERNNISTNKHTIIQAFSLKEDLESLGINCKVNLVTLIDIVNFYPSIMYKMTEKAVWYFIKRFNKDKKNKLELALELLITGIST